jgi:hypothetical protein
MKVRPLVLVGAAFSLGLLSALFFPISAVERRRIGPLRERALQRARENAATAFERGKRVAAETALAAIHA